jgi:hypothetical protein
VDVRQLNKKVWPFTIKLKGTNNDYYTWCSESLGKMYSNWYLYEEGSETTIAFKDEESLLVFKLRWANGN